MQFTPGLYRQAVTPVRPSGFLARGDIPALLGYARKGPTAFAEDGTNDPAGIPVRLHSLGEFEELFGGPLNHGFLWHSVKGFFENGGAACYVIRVVSQQAKAAEAVRSRLDDVKDKPVRRVSWRAQASFPWLTIDPRKRSTSLQDESASWVQTFEQVIRDYGMRTPDTGAHGNGLTLRVTRTANVRTETVVDSADAGNVSSVHSLAGLEVGSILELTQTGADGQSVATIRKPFKIDAARQKIVWSNDFAGSGFDRSKPIRLTSVEFDVAIYGEGKLLQGFAALSPNPAHSRAFSKVLTASCRTVDFAPAILGADDSEVLQEEASVFLATVDWTMKDTWPPEGDYDLGGGVDGLDSIRKQDWLNSFLPVRRLFDAAMIAGPDIVLPPAGLPLFEIVPSDAADCCDLSPVEPGYFRGRVTSIGSDGIEFDLPGVSVEVKGPGRTATTGVDGSFLVSDIGLSLVTIKLSKTGFEPLEFQVQPFAYVPSIPLPLSITAISAPTVFQNDEIIELQTAMANPANVGPYKIAFVDPPSPSLRIDQLTTWRARLGDSARMGFFAPWLNIPATSRNGALLPAISLPPSGHVAGAFAQAEAAIGIHRTGANLQLRYVEGVTLAIDDRLQEGLNPIGVNAIRALPGRGIRIFGTRSLSSDAEWRYLTTRRIVDAVEKSLESALRWMVFEPNNLITRHSVEVSASILLDRLFRQGILSGTLPEGAYSAKCDLENNPDPVRDEGKLVVEIGIAPTQPFEFIYFRLGHEFEAMQVTEL